MSSKLPKIVVLDGVTLNPGDLSWDGLKQLGDCAFYDRTLPEETIERAKGAEILLTNKVVLSSEMLEALDALRFIGVTATGYNVVDVEAAQERGITVSNVPVYSTGSVAQMVFAHLLNFTQHTAEHSLAARAGRWSSAVDWCFWDFPLIELEGKTMGIVGLGRIGLATAKLASAFGMNVIATSRTSKNFLNGVDRVDLETIFRDSDVVILHCPLTEETEKIVNAERLALMKPSAFLINTSRGPLIDEVALAAALEADEIAGAGLDVLSTEPPASDNPLLKAKNCTITPHIAWATLSARSRLLQTTVENVAAFLDGKSQNVVN